MPYTSKIKAFEQNFEKLTRDIDIAKKDAKPDQELIDSLNKQRAMVYQELTRLRRLQYEEEYERVGYGDDR